MFDLRMLGFVRGVSLPALHRLVPFGVLGFALSVASGFMFVVTTPDQYLYNPAWQTTNAIENGKVYVSTQNEMLQSGTDIGRTIRIARNWLRR